MPAANAAGSELDPADCVLASYATQSSAGDGLDRPALQQAFFMPLAGNSLGAEDAVAGVAETGDDVAVLVEVAVEGGDEDVHVGMIML